MKLKEIAKAFGHKLIGNKFMKTMVVRALQNLPPETIKFVTRTTWFVSSFDDGWAFTLRGDELKKNEYLIFLTDELLESDERQITWTITHEIGHVVLGHRNSIGKVQTKAEVKRQEKEADEFAKKFLG